MSGCSIHQKHLVGQSHCSMEHMVRHGSQRSDSMTVDHLAEISGTQQDLEGRRSTGPENWLVDHVFHDEEEETLSLVTCESLCRRRSNTIRPRSGRYSGRSSFGIGHDWRWS